MNRHGRSRKLLVSVLAAAMVLAVIIVFLPSIASATLAPGIVRDLVEKQVNGSATVENVKLRWGGPHSITGLVVRDAGGNAVADVDLHLKATFLQLALSRMESYSITVSGTVNAVVYDDYRTSLDELLTSGGNDAKKTDHRDEPQRRQGFTPVHITLLELGLTIDDHIRDETMDLTIDAGEIRASPGEPISVSFNGTASREQVNGSFTIGGEIVNLIQSDGSITPDGASVQMKIAADTLPLPATTQVDELRSMNLVALADDLSEQLGIAGNFELALADAFGGSDGATSTIAVDAALLQPVDADLAFNMTPATMTGRVDARRIPADLLQLIMTKALPDTPILVSRDVGPMVNASVSVGGGQQRDLAVSVDADHVAITINGGIELLEDSADFSAAAIEIASIDARMTMQPALLATLTDGRAMLDRPTPVRLNAGSIRVPPALNGRRSLSELAGNITLQIEEPFNLTADDSQAPLQFDGVQLSAATMRLGEQATVFGTAIINRGTLTINQRVSHLLAADGSWQADASRWTPAGQITLQHLPVTVFTSLAAGLPTPVRDHLTGSVDATLTTTPGDDGELTASLDVNADQFTGTVRAVRSPSAVRIDEATLTATVEPDLVAAWQAGTDTPIALEASLPITVALLQPVTLPWSDENSLIGPDGPVFATIETDRAIRLLNLPALAEPLELRDTSINLIAEASGDRPSFNVAASALWHTQSTDRTVGEIMFEAFLPLNGVDDDDTSTVSEIRLSLERLAVRRLERALGRDVDSLAKWVGSRGNLHLTATPGGDHRPTVGTFDAAFAQLAGTFDFELSNDDIFTIAGRSSELSITAAALNQWLRMQPDAGTHIVADVPGSVTVTKLMLPLALLNGEPIDPADVRMDIDVAAGPLTIADTTGEQTTLTGLRTTIDATSLHEPVRIAMTGEVPGGAEAPAGTVELNAAVTGLLDAQHRFDSTGAVVNMTLAGDALPVAVADALGGYDGLLIAAIGPTAAATIDADEFSASSGTIDGTVTTEHGSLNAYLIGSAGQLTVEQSHPVQASLELTPAFRDRVLQPIHPLFADIRSTEQPIRASVTSATIPVNGDVSQLNADLQLTVGAIELDSGSLLLGVLDLFRESQATVPGRIEPITATVRSGIVTYERFAVVLDKYTLSFHGQVNLNTRTVDLRFDVPGTAVTQTFHELEGYLDKLVIPFRTHGTIGDVRTEIAPDYNLAEEAARAGFRGVLERELGDEIGDFLDELLKGGSRKKNKNNTPPDR